MQRRKKNWTCCMCNLKNALLFNTEIWRFKNLMNLNDLNGFFETPDMFSKSAERLGG